MRDVESGAEVAIARGGKVIAKLVRFDEAPARRWGIFEGQVEISDDAFAPLDDSADREGPVDP